MVLSVAVAAIPSRIAAQDSPGEVTPRAMADSTYAVRITVDALADGIRRGRLDPRQVDDPQLAAAVGRLASAGAKRSRRPPQAALGALWDFQIDSLTFQPQGRDVLRALAQVYLAIFWGHSASTLRAVRVNGTLATSRTPVTTES